MLVILTDQQILSTQTVCSSCLLATHQGQPRWHEGHLGCGHSLRSSENHQPTLYECTMGFKLVEVDDYFHQSTLKVS